MSYVLPEICADRALSTEWFPTKAQCLIYRNWGSVAPQKLAQLLQCSEEELLAAAADMGLQPVQCDFGAWVDRGYITLIRNNWHLLDYDGLCCLLDWSREQLAFILQEDDFLSVKLGNFKPYAENPRLIPLNEAQKARTAEIKRITEEICASVPAPTVAPFDFFAHTYVAADDASNGAHRFQKKLIYSYCALYGDTFSDRRLIDLSFPEQMLKAYAALGITGIWTQGILSKLAPYPFADGMDEGYEKRLDGVRYLIQRLARYGIKLYLYLNEPRALSQEALQDRDDVRGHRTDKGLACLCVRTEPVQRYLREAVAYVVREAKGLGGIYTITASENQTNCMSHIKQKSYYKLNCPHCAGHTRAENYALVNRLICEGARSADPNIDIIAYAWEWGDVAESCAVVDELPTDVAVMNVSETRMTKQIGDTETRVIDYSISVVGPGDFSKALWRHAAQSGHSCIAKVQLNNTWELSSVPYIPVPDKIYAHVKGLIETGSVDALMLSWTLGGYPSPMLKMPDILSARANDLPTPAEVYAQIFKGADTKTLTEVFRIFSDAFDHYPFCLQSAYNGPQQSTPANLLYPAPSGFSATMVCYPYDDLELWRGIFPTESYVEQLEKMAKKWQEGFALLSTVDRSKNPYLCELFDVSEACLVHFCGMYNQCRFVQERSDLSRCKAILQEEIELALRALRLVGKNATIGYESSNHYFYTAGNLMEKIVNCRYLLDRLQ